MTSRGSLVFKGQPRSWLDYWVLLWLVAGLIGLVYSRFLLSMSIIGLSTLLLLPQSRQGKLLPDWRLLFSPERRVWLGLIIIYLGVVLSGINSHSVDGWLHHLRIRLPMLTLPLALYAATPLKREVWRWIMTAFIILLSISSTPVTWHYAQHFTEVQEALGQGIAMDTPTSHIRYSLMVAFGVLIGGYLWWDQRQWWLAVMTSWLFIFLHLLAVRSGIAVFYCTAILLMMTAAFRTKRWLPSLAVVIGLIGTGWLATQVVPSLNRRISYMMYDLKQYQKGDGKLYSDSERIASLRAGLYLTKTYPWLGVGIGDLQAENRRTYEHLNLNTERAHLPHNQLLFISAGSGLVGLLIFCFGYGWVIVYSRYRTSALTILLLVGVSFMVEHTLDTAVGVGFFMMMVSLSLWVEPTSLKAK